MKLFKDSGRMFLLSALVFAVVVAQTSCAVQAADKKVVLKCGGIQAVEDLSTVAMNKMAAIAKAKSGGTVDIQIFPAGQIGAATNEVEAVSMGSQDMFVDAGSWVATFVPDKLVESMFFAFKDEEHYRRYLNSKMMKEFEAAFRKEKGIRVLANNWIRIPRSISSKKPVKSLDDFKGLKMRVPDIKGYLESISALGGKPTQVAWGETYLALKQGVVDACESPMDSMYTMKFYEPTKIISVTEHIRDDMVVMINDRKFKSLSKKQQSALLAASKEAGEWYSQAVKKSLNSYIDKMKAEGTQFIQPDAASLNAMRKKIAERAKKLEKSGLWKAGLYKKIQAL